MWYEDYQGPLKDEKKNTPKVRETSNETLSDAATQQEAPRTESRRDDPEDVIVEETSGDVVTQKLLSDGATEEIPPDIVTQT